MTLLWVICVLCSILVLLVSVVAIRLYKLEKKISIYVAYITDKQGEMEKNLNTLAKVMQIYEDATQLVKKKYTAAQIQERFQRTPR
jgi:hypothetical protein